ncbi:hypothetical protein MANES_04G155750v8 [Manihot esculenta]|uniref:Uncharacterized protein n=1 Tax=Manihot esculenta TaxID=3983 RepID=A0ACB7HWS5_MANES|nr:hypothetical protein MANES_04G155750v8 [Manihot esculenta]
MIKSKKLMKIVRRWQKSATRAGKRFVLSDRNSRRKRHIYWLRKAIRYLRSDNDHYQHDKKNVLPVVGITNLLDLVQLIVSWRSD